MRDVKTQAVFSLRGSLWIHLPKVVYENERVIQAALNIEEDMDSLRYNKIILQLTLMYGMHDYYLLFFRFFPD